MPTALICSEGQGSAAELVRILSTLDKWNFHILANSDFSKGCSEVFQKQIDLHFLIYNKHLSKNAIQELDSIRLKLPFASIIYYNSSIVNRQYLFLTKYDVKSCIVGLNRKQYLLNRLPRLWDTHWKKIPSLIYQNGTISAKNTAKNIISCIEDHTLSYCNLQNLANYFGIHKSHFRIEFKSTFGINFREFKQKLYNYYERVLLIENNFKPSEVYEVLNYSNPANFSRSFRNRHGENWRKFNGVEVEMSQ